MRKDSSELLYCTKRYLPKSQTIHKLSCGVLAETERESWSFLFQRFFNVKTECLNVYNDFLDSSLAAYLPCLSTSRRTSSRILANSTTQFT